LQVGDVKWNDSTLASTVDAAGAGNQQTWALKGTED